MHTIDTINLHPNHDISSLSSESPNSSPSYPSYTSYPSYPSNYDHGNHGKQQQRQYDDSYEEEVKYANSNTNKHCKPSVVLLCVPELLEASILDDAKYYSEAYLKHQDIFSSNDNVKATKKKNFMSRWIAKVQYQYNMNSNACHYYNKPLLAEDLYNDIYPKMIKLHKIKILSFLDPNTYNKSHLHSIRLPHLYHEYGAVSNKFGDVHITYLPAAKQSKDSYHTSCDYNGYHYTYKLYDYVNLKKHNGIQYVAETYFYKQKIGGYNNYGKRNRNRNKRNHQYGKKEILDLKHSQDDNYVAFLLCFVWNLFWIFDQNCHKDGQMRKSIKFKICKKMANILNKYHCKLPHDGANENDINHQKNVSIDCSMYQKNKNNINQSENVNDRIRPINYRFSDNNDNNNNNDYHSSFSSQSRQDYDNVSYSDYNSGPLKMEKW